MAFTGVLLILVILLSGCGSGNNSSSNKYGGTLTSVPSPKGPWTRNFNPFLPNSDLYGSQGLVYETLLFFNRMDGTVKPWLASSYSFSSDATSITFNLQHNVKWSDGQAFTSADVKFTLDLMHRFPAIDTSGLWKAISNVSTPDDYTVTVAFNQPAVPLLWYLGGQTYIVAQHTWQNVSDPATYTDPNPMGTGPFTLKSFDSQVYVYTKNKNYWQAGKPYIDEIRYPAYNSNTSADLLLSQGGVDWTGLFTPDVNKTFVQRNPNTNHYWFPPSNVVMLYLNTAEAPFNNLSVRQAISYALDREQMYKVAESGYEPVASPTALVLPANKSFLDQTYANAAFTQDLAKATSLLDGAGFKKGADGIYTDASGKRLSFKLNVVSGWTDWVTDCQIMATNLKAIGIDVTVNAIDFNSYISALSNGTFDMAISWTNPGPTPFFLYDSLLNSHNTAPIGKAAASNWERWSDPATDQLLHQYASSPDQATEMQAIQGIEKIMVEQLPAIPLVEGATWYEYSTARFVGWPDASNPYAMPSPYSAPDLEVVAINVHKP
jgi:peptide/nickel transport system substrate-binding protein